ncbi:hypothetical protein [Nannocystis bainbridge]|uniref:Uncharacterized protein n=1 Tax=Nannocystis bainbridge TaxID=2995303 RepID=A0ABT5DVI7_9BACT|nr:hypothetical protein [Nannocystis bainbridge]MDC0717641.1 hypothetical protein [Nannocystis bainbridge]
MEHVFAVIWIAAPRRTSARAQPREQGGRDGGVVQQLEGGDDGGLRCGFDPRETVEQRGDVIARAEAAEGERRGGGVGVEVTGDERRDRGVAEAADGREQLLEIAAGFFSDFCRGLRCARRGGGEDALQDRARHAGPALGQDAEDRGVLGGKSIVEPLDEQLFGRATG